MALLLSGALFEIRWHVLPVPPERANERQCELQCVLEAGCSAALQPARGACFDFGLVFFFSLDNKAWQEFDRHRISDPAGECDPAIAGVA